MSTRTSVPISSSTVSEAAVAIAEADHCQAGGAIALSGAVAAALAQATANVTIADGTPTPSPARELQQHMAHARSRLLAIADEDARAIGEFVELRRSAQALRGYELLCEGPREAADIAVAATQAMQRFRPNVGGRGKDDLEFAITLMYGAARSAAQLLDSNLRIWPLPELLARFEGDVERLFSVISSLVPIGRIRPPGSDLPRPL
jgi:hypothetical protein